MYVLCICYDDKLFNLYLLFLSFQLVDLDAISAPTVDDIDDDSVIDDAGLQQDDLIEELLGGQDSPAVDDSLEVPECGVCTSMAAVNGRVGVYRIIILFNLS